MEQEIPPRTSKEGLDAREWNQPSLDATILTILLQQQVIFVENKIGYDYIKTKHNNKKSRIILEVSKRLKQRMV